MLLTRHFVFVHMPKTGGTFLNEVIREHAPANWDLQQLESHTPAAQVPASHANLPIFGFVRNPFDWYVSWYFYHHEKYALGEVEPGHQFSKASQNSELPFCETLQRLMTIYLQDGKGFYTQMLEEKFGAKLALVNVLRTETLRSDALGWLEQLPIAIPKSMAHALEKNPGVNKSQRRHYSCYYDDQTISLISSKENDVIRRFGYNFEAKYE